MSSQSLGQGLIPIINRLQDIFNQVTLDFKLTLPQLAVVGSQSSGKSSVLEALVGRDFLPRGPDICTRRPLVLQLIQINKKENEEEWGEFLHLPEQRFTDFEEIRKEIENETDRVAGDGKAISNKPIRLKIYSPDVLTMTLVDLPGITRVPIGDQPTNIEKQIRDMIYEYIQHPTCIILAVSAANVDLANSDALSMARSFDPDGNRTIGILTKLDIMDKGTNCVSVLKNEVVPLRLGYIGIVNRSQDDINKKRKMAEARKNENEFFAKHFEYREVASQCGINNLAINLNQILIDHIRLILPNLRSQINKELELKLSELEIYGDAPSLDSRVEKGGLLLKILSDYCNRFNAMLDGTCELVGTDLKGGAKIRDIFQNGFYKVLYKMDWRKDLTNEMIETTIKNSSGASGSLLIPQEPFEIIVRRSIKKLLEPSLRCKELVQDELLRIAIDCEPADLARFSKLRHVVAEVFGDYIRLGGAPAIEMIRTLIDCEYDYINYDHPRFIGGSQAVAEVLSDRRMRSIQAIPLNNKLKRTASQNLDKENLKETNQESGIKPTIMINAARPVYRTSIDFSPRSIGFRGFGTRRFPGMDISAKADVQSESSDTSNQNQQNDERSVGSWFNIFNRNAEKQDSNNNNNALNENSSASASASTIQIGEKSTNNSSFSKTTPSTIENPELLSQVVGLYGQMDLTVEITRKLVDNYMSIVQGNISDLVPKTIMHFLVHKLKRGMQQHLIGTLYKEENFDGFMSERKDITEKRKKCQEAVKALKEALMTLDVIPQHLAENVTETSPYISRIQMPYNVNDVIGSSNPFGIDVDIMPGSNNKKIN